MVLDTMTCDFEAGDEHVGLRVYEAHSLIYLYWKKHARGEQFQAGFRAAFDEVKKRNLRCWISDTRLLDYADATDQKWVLEVAGSLMARSKLEKVAHVVTDESIRSLVAYQMADKLHATYPEKQVQIEIFTHLPDALYWLDVA